MDKVKEVLEKIKLGLAIDENDLKVVHANLGSIPQDALVRLGLVTAPAIKAVEAPVVPTLTVEPTPVIDTVVETPKKVKKGKR